MVQTPYFRGDKIVSFGEKLAASEQFMVLFQEGMDLVSRAANYLDGDGREEAKLLPRAAAVAYAVESMRLTTRLLQVASWLLLQRAVNEGELSRAEAAAEKRRIPLSEQPSCPTRMFSSACRRVCATSLGYRFACRRGLSISIF
jgi:regulator of CtrA degradation